MAISPSRLAYVYACPKFKPSPFTTEAADEGTRLHAYMETLVKTKPYTLWVETIEKDPSLSADSKDILVKAAAETSQFVSFAPEYRALDEGLSYVKPGEKKHRLMPGLYPELKIATSKNTFGYIDLLIVDPSGCLTIIDYKFARNEGSYDLQMGAYAVTVTDLIEGAVSVTAHIVAPMLDNEEPWEQTFTDDDLKEMRSLIEQINVSSEDPNEDGKPGDHCSRCKWASNCRYLGSVAVRTAKETDETSLSTMPIQQVMKAETIEARSERRNLISILSALVDAVKEDDKKFFAENPDAQLIGFSKSVSRGRASLDGTRTAEIVEALIASIPGVTVSSVLSCASISESKIQEMVKTFAPSTPPQTVSDVLGPFIKYGTPFVTLRKTNRKSHKPKKG